MSYTITDIAKAAGVSTATVSRMINGSGYVGEKTKVKIQEAIDRLNYVPNAAAVALSSRQSRVIGLMVPEISNTFFGEIIEGISGLAEAAGYVVMIINTGESKSRELQAVKSLKKQNLCGLLITPTCDSRLDNPEFYDILDKWDIPIVMMDRQVEGYQGVYYDNEQGMYDLTSHLIDKGFNDICLMVGDLKLELARARLRGYEKAMKRAGNQSHLLYGDFSRDTAYDVMKEFSSQAIISSNNTMTEGIIKYFKEHDMTKPIASFDHVYWASLMGYDLTYLRREAINLGHQAYELLIKLINKERVEDILMEMSLESE